MSHSILPECKEEDDWNLGPPATMALAWAKRLRELTGVHFWTPHKMALGNVASTMAEAGLVREDMLSATPGNERRTGRIAPLIKGAPIYWEPLEKDILDGTLLMDSLNIWRLNLLGLRVCDMFLGLYTSPSHGVGMESSLALEYKKPMVGAYEKTPCSLMVHGLFAEAEAELVHMPKLLDDAPAVASAIISLIRSREWPDTVESMWCSNLMEKMTSFEDSRYGGKAAGRHRGHDEIHHIGGSDSPQKEWWNRVVMSDGLDGLDGVKRWMEMKADGSIDNPEDG
jgi:hypothetical protein